MAFEAIRERQGAPRVSCICDDCLRSETVAVPRGKSASDGDGYGLGRRGGMVRGGELQAIRRTQLPCAGQN
jgi:hypothetical protein